MRQQVHPRVFTSSVMPFSTSAADCGVPWEAARKVAYLRNSETGTMGISPRPWIEPTKMGAYSFKQTIYIYVYIDNYIYIIYVQHIVHMFVDWIMPFFSPCFTFFLLEATSFLRAQARYRKFVVHICRQKCGLEFPTQQNSGRHVRVKKLGRDEACWK